jgi:DNA-binding GntR family transcriptional regulator
MDLAMELSAIPGTYIEAVQQRLREDIVSGRLAPREKLRLAELKTRYEMGSSPLREALSRLVGEGLVTFEGNKGFRVRGLSREDLADIAYMRTAVETFAIRTAIERGGESVG